MKNIFYLLLILLLGAGCTKKYKDFNTDPNNATDEDLKHDNLGLGSFLLQMQTKMIPSQTDGNNGDVNSYQLIYSLMGDIYSGQQGASNAFSSNGINNTTYAMIPGWYGAAFPYAYQNEMGPWYQVKTRAATLKASTTYAVAQILKVMAMHRITDTYGPLPYLNFTPGSSSTPYNSQQEIYQSFFRELDSAISVLTTFVGASPDARPLAKYDLIYKGDFNKWLKFANTLKLRLALHVVYADHALAKKAAEEAVAAGVMTSNDDNALLVVDGVSSVNPLYMICYSYGDTRMGANMESFLKGYKDPRISLLFNKGTGALADDYHGIRPGSMFSGHSYDVFSTLNVTAGTPIQWMVAAEAWFLRAEGAVWGWNMNGTAKDLYETGIKTAFAQPIGGTQKVAGDATAYLNDGTNMPAQFVDPITGSNSVKNGDKMLSTITIKWNDSDNNELKQERIITQKWLAIYPDGMEAWTEFRRTGYPKIFQIPRSYGMPTAQLKNGTIRRSPFPQNEYLNNSANVQKGVSLLGGPDNIATTLWWDKK